MTYSFLSESSVPGSNPIITSAFTADPAPLVVGDTVYLYTSHDKATGDVLFAMDDWLAFSSQDLRHWTALGPVMRETDFAWATASKSAWAAQAVEKDGKFYRYGRKPPSRCSGGQEYVMLLGCVSLPAGMTVGMTYGVMVTAVVSWATAVIELALLL